MLIEAGLARAGGALIEGPGNAARAAFRLRSEAAGDPSPFAFTTACAGRARAHSGPLPDRR